MLTPPLPCDDKESRDCLRVCYFNANSILAHIEQVRFFLASHPTFHVIGVTETKLGPVVEDAMVSLKEYSLGRHDRRTTGGGVALYVHNSLSVTCLCKSSTVWTVGASFPEYLLCEVASKGGLPHLRGGGL